MFNKGDKVIVKCMRKHNIPCPYVKETEGVVKFQGKDWVEVTINNLDFSFDLCEVELKGRDSNVQVTVSIDPKHINALDSWVAARQPRPKVLLAPGDVINWTGDIYVVNDDSEFIKITNDGSNTTGTFLWDYPDGIDADNILFIHKTAR